jgi:3-oxoacyl-[acyl-carrier protein] reductase
MELAAEGADVVLSGRDGIVLESAREELSEATGARIEAVPADTSEPAGVQRVIDAAFSAFGKVDILVTNTGGPPAGSFDSLTPENWGQAVRQLLESAVNFARGVLPGMREREWGRIVNVTSVAVKQPIDGLMLSNSIRAGLTGFARTLANEVAPHGITVNNVLPGYTRTERLVELAEHLASSGAAESIEAAFGAWEKEIPAGRLADPRELGALVAFLASERAGYITGTSIAVDGGWTRGLL